MRSALRNRGHRYLKYTRSMCTQNELPLKKALLLNKLSRFEIEKLRHPNLTKVQLQENICRRGIDYQAMINHHKINKEFQAKIESAFLNFNIETRSVTRLNYTDDNINWCDAVFPIGGDGTFLLAASRIPNRMKSVIGFNSDPCRSEGHLCLPKKYSSDIHSALKKLLTGEFKWLFRTRIRVSLYSDNITGSLIELHDVVAGERRVTWEAKNISGRCTLPVLALNEVFVGEILSAKVSYFEVKTDRGEGPTRVKSSGLCACTGTGSTSWHFSMNRFSQQDIREIIQLYLNVTGDSVKENIIPEICDRFNKKFIFDPEDFKLGYTIRDLIYAGVWPKPKGLLEPRGFAKRLEIKSRCSDAGLAIDGGVSFPFNDGTTALLEIFPEDALRTVQLL